MGIKVATLCLVREPTIRGASSLRELSDRGHCEDLVTEAATAQRYRTVARSRNVPGMMAAHHVPMTTFSDRVIHNAPSAWLWRGAGG